MIVIVINVVVVSNVVVMPWPFIGEHPATPSPAVRPTTCNTTSHLTQLRFVSIKTTEVPARIHVLPSYLLPVGSTTCATNVSASMAQQPELWDRLGKELKAPEDYCVANVDKAERLKELIKAVYELASSFSARGSGPLKSVLIQGVDEETLWEQLQTRNNPLLKYLRKYMKSASNRNLEFIPMEEDVTSEDVSEEEMDEDEDEDVDADDHDEVDEDGDNDCGDEDDEQEEEDSSDGEDEAESYDSDDVTNEEEDDGAAEEPRKKIGSSGDGWDTDEELGMEAWLDATEELDEKHRQKQENREKRVKANTMDQVSAGLGDTAAPCRRLTKGPCAVGRRAGG